jgi:hypothetical protein
MGMGDDAALLTILGALTASRTQSSFLDCKWKRDKNSKEMFCRKSHQSLSIDV